MTTTAHPAATRSRGVGTFLLRRWPTALAIALELVSWGIGTVRAGQILPLLPALYVIVAVLRRRGASWPVLLASMALLFGLQLQDRVDPTIAILSLATAVAVVGLFRPSARGELAVQFGGLVPFGGLALTGLTVTPDAARFVLAAGWLGHARCIRPCRPECNAPGSSSWPSWSATSAGWSPGAASRADAYRSAREQGWI